MEKLRSSLHQIRGLLKEHSLLTRESTEKAAEKAIKYEPTEKVWDGNTLDQARISENPKVLAAQGSEWYPTPPFCSSDTHLTTSI